MYHADGDLQAELNKRISQVRQAFAEVRRAVFCNRQISISARVQLLNSLIASRLFYAMATWPTPTKHQCNQVDGAMMKCYRVIISNGLWSRKDCKSDQALRAQYGLPDFRTHLMRHRVNYLQTIAHFDAPFYLQALLAEDSKQTGWLSDVRQDLRTLATGRPLPITIDVLQDFQRPELLQQIATCPSWNTRIATACRLHTTDYGCLQCSGTAGTYLEPAP